jgi:ATP-dependent DNA helicase RecQ
LGIQAAFLNSSLSSGEKFQIMSNCQQYKLLYVSPERLLDESFLQFLSGIPISFFVIDEAHCISAWGHSFRPEYRKLSSLKKLFPTKPIMALTATATPDVQNDIMMQLSIPKHQFIKSSFERENLSIKISPRLSGNRQILEFCKARPDQSGIIYASTRKKVDQLTELLHSEGFSVGKYHAGLPDADRSRIQESFVRDKTQIIVATLAFGMGINKSNVRFVLHYDLPKNMEQYYQEIGRAGRDSLAADCLLLYSQGDIIIQKRFIDEIPDQAIALHLKRKTEQLLAFCNSANCRTKDILGYFGEFYNKENCSHCDNCTELTDTIDGTEISQKIVSGVYRVGQRFGLNYVIDTLIGSKNNKILQFGHDSLSTYGLLSNFSRKELIHFMYALINEGYLYVTDDQFPIVKLTKKSWPISAIKNINFKRLPETTKAIKKKSTPEQILNHNPDLYTKLKRLRKEIADKQNIPAFMVFHDSTLVDLSEKAPKTTSDLLLINGIGPKKIHAYGEEILRCIVTD